MRPDPLRDGHPVSDKRKTRFTASYLRGFRLLPKGIFPTARLHSTANESILDNTVTIKAFNAVTWDRVSDEGATHADFRMAVTATDRLIIRIPGIYQVSIGATWASDSTGYRKIGIKVNGNLSAAVLQDAVATAVTMQGLTDPMELKSDDYLELEVLQTSGGALNVIGVVTFRPFLAAVWVGG